MDQQFKVRGQPGSKVDVQLEPASIGKHRIRLQQTTAIPRAFLDARAEERKAAGRAPLGDSHGAWQKVAEIPLSLLFAKIPPDAWQDERALNKLLNDPDLRFFRSDGEHRRA